MTRNIIFFIKYLTLFLFFSTILIAEELTIIPLKKPILDIITAQQKLTQGIIRPKSKPIEKVEDLQSLKKVTKPKSKPSKETKQQSKNTKSDKNIAEKITIKKQSNRDKTKTSFLIPKSKPLVVKKNLQQQRKSQNITAKEILI